MMRLPHYFTLQTASWKPNLRVLAMAGLLVSIIGSVAGTAA